jgi:hypothetical protein
VIRDISLAYCITSFSQKLTKPLSTRQTGIVLPNERDEGTVNQSMASRSSLGHVLKSEDLSQNSAVPANPSTKNGFKSARQ